MTTIPVEPTGLWRVWWTYTEPFRLVLRLIAERNRHRTMLQMATSGARLVGHQAAGNPWWSLPTAVVLVTGLPWWLVVVVGLVVEVALVVHWRRTGVRHAAAQWRLAWKFHRVWPRVWTDVAAKSRQIQDRESGGSGESRARSIRPVVDHPRMPWRFWLRWPVITFRIGVAPGRSFGQFEQIIDQMGANLPWIHSVELEYLTDRSSFGLLHVAVEDLLAEIDEPDWLDGGRSNVVDLPDWLADDDGEEAA